jgi:hypothetical protein
MDNTNTNIAATDSPKNINKILLFILLVVIAISLVLVSVYLYNQYRGAKNNKADVSQSTPSPNIVIQNDPSLIKKSAPFVYNVGLPLGKVGTVYKTAVQTGVYDLNVQINGRAESGLPLDLQLTSCSTEYNSPDIAKIAAKNSYGKCIIEGVPQESGNFTVRLYFSIQGGPQNVYKDLPLVISP